MNSGRDSPKEGKSDEVWAIWPTFVYNRNMDPKVTLEPLDELLSRHHPDNPKDHDIGAIIESIDEFGFVRNVMMNETDGLLLYGHGTTTALEMMRSSGEYEIPKRISERDDGMWLIPTDRGVELDPLTAKRYVVADNRDAELGGWNEPRLVDNLIQWAGRDGSLLRGTGFDQEDVDRLVSMVASETEFYDSTKLDGAVGQPEAAEGTQAFILYVSFSSKELFDRALEIITYGERRSQSPKYRYANVIGDDFIDRWGKDLVP